MGGLILKNLHQDNLQSGVCKTFFQITEKTAFLIRQANQAVSSLVTSERDKDMSRVLIFL